MELVYDVIVVGAGPGGSACAALCYEKGLRVLLLEKGKYPKDKICGDAISGKSAAVLNDLNLVDEVAVNPNARVYGVLFSSPKKDEIVIPFPQKDLNAPEPKPGYVQRRMVFDNIVFQHAKSIVNTIEEFSVNDLIQENNFVVGVKGKHKDGREQEFRGKVVVGADGAASVVARKLGVEQKDPDHIIMAIRAYYRGITGMTPNIELHFIESIIPGYFWIFPLEDGTANVGIGMVKSDMQKTKMNLTEAMFKAIEEDPLFKNRFKNAEIEGPVRGWTLPSGSKRTKNHGNGWILIGDAASLIDPFSGEGIGNAMTSGKYASEVISEALRANDFSEKFFYKYEKMIQENLDPELKNSYSLQKWGKHKWLLNFLIGKASKNKQVQELLSGMLVNEEAKKKLYSPLFYLKLLFS